MKTTIILLAATLAFTFGSCGNSGKEVKVEKAAEHNESSDAHHEHEHAANDSTNHEGHNHAEGEAHQHNH